MAPTALPWIPENRQFNLTRRWESTRRLRAPVGPMPRRRAGGDRAIPRCGHLSEVGEEVAFSPTSKKQLSSPVARRHKWMMQYLLASLIGLVGGITSGMFGIGGGIVMVPAMVLLLSPPVRDIKHAIGTSLCIIVPTAMMGAYKHVQASQVEWKIALIMAPLAIAGGYLGAWLTTEQLEPAFLKRAFGGLLILVGLKLILGK